MSLAPTAPTPLAGPAALPWRFPAAHCHQGIPLGNGLFGALLWVDEDSSLVRITLNRADYWLHAGGWEWPEEATYANLRRWLEARDEVSLRRVFEGRVSADAPHNDRPTRLPMGRVDVRLGEAANGTRLSAGLLSLDTSEAALGAEDAGASDAVVRAVLVRHVPLLALRVRGTFSLEGRPPADKEVVAYLREHSFPEPVRFGDGHDGGWVQEGGGEPALCVAWRTAGQEAFIAATYGADGRAARAAAQQALARAAERGYDALAAETAIWWRDWWARAAQVDVPDQTAALLYRLGLYKLGGLSVPAGAHYQEPGRTWPAASLQGPWVEEYRLPPWSGDYHFNVNVQECYWPAYGGNHLETLDPLEQMLKAWEPRLRENARRYVGVDDGLLLPHAVDDRATCMGGFWTGQTDHGSTAWAGQLLWQRYRHTLDADYLRDTAYPFLRGAMRTYEGMLEADPQNAGALYLPVGVSPEFGGSQAQAWGRNASFQLACIHFLCGALLHASEALGLEGDDQRRWRDVCKRLPLGSVGKVALNVRGTGSTRPPDGSPASAVPPGERELLLWDGQPLTESHRHHSHLAAVYPFGLLDPLSHHDDRLLVGNSMRRLALEGMGAWTGWCMPWAAIVHARVGQGDTAALLLETFRRAFMGQGYYSTHDAVFRGLTVMASRPEIMQVEASLGAAAAVLELVAQTNAPGGGVLRVFSGTPAAWRDVSFRGVRAEGAFLLDAVRAGGETQEVRVRSEAGGTLRLAHPFGPRGATVTTSAGTEHYLNARELPVLTIASAPGEEVVLRPE